MPYNGQIDESEPSEDPFKNAGFQKHAILRQSQYENSIKKAKHPQKQ